MSLLKTKLLPWILQMLPGLLQPTCGFSCYLSECMLVGISQLA